MASVVISPLSPSREASTKANLSSALISSLASTTTTVAPTTTPATQTTPGLTSTKETEAELSSKCELNKENQPIGAINKLSSELTSLSILTAVSNNNNNTIEAINANIKPSKSSIKDAHNNVHRDTMFTLKKWNLVAMWSWDVECEVCAICRTPLMDSCLKCQTDNKNDDCVVVWGDCNHSFHNCCMSQWVKSRNLCPLCQSEWHVQRIGR